MAVREILKFGDKLLRKVSRKVKNIDEETLGIVQDLKDTLYASSGVGLSAPQIGILKRIIFIDLGKENTNPVILINPKIVKKMGRNEGPEGCLSYNGHEGIVVRPKKVIVVGKDINGNEVRYNAEGLFARAFCHEIDHLDGVLYTDKAKKIYKVEDF
ncbi:peptide deformylase [Clostridium autoethanogenum]|uniref:Peptide deformylase n=1 Tax=Clostridium autoethanogenum TaxID=84023 RepID=A0A3M0SLZ1_9CLOT|nr:peptide deformylase [Clostridium autoethanogenum]RMC99522.1 peptide deformylase [Clostridium autoethanogenum]